MSILQALVPQASSDVVAIFPEVDAIDTGSLPAFLPVQVFKDARPMKLSVSESAKLASHPLENGQPKIDHKIQLPVEIVITFIIRSDKLRQTYFLIRQAFLNSLSFAIQTRVNTYTNMLIEAMPHDEDPQLSDTISLVVKFIEAQNVSSENSELSTNDVSNPIDSSTIDRGFQEAKKATASQSNSGSLLYRTFLGK